MIQVCHTVQWDNTTTTPPNTIKNPQSSPRKKKLSEENLEWALLSEIYLSLYTMQWKMQLDRKTLEINLSWK